MTGLEIEWERIVSQTRHLRSLPLLRPLSGPQVVHQVKGEGISAVLLIGPEKQRVTWLNPRVKPFREAWGVQTCRYKNLD
jgi:hypothetical protein